MNADLADRIHECLLAAPMMTARQIGKTLSVDKHVINQTLYKSDRFENDGGRIPTWSAVVKQPELPEGAELCDECAKYYPRSEMKEDRTTFDKVAWWCKQCTATWSAVVKQPELPEGAELVHYKGDIVGYCLPGQLGINRIVVTP